MGYVAKMDMILALEDSIDLIPKKLLPRVLMVRMRSAAVGDEEPMPLARAPRSRATSLEPEIDIVDEVYQLEEMGPALAPLHFMATPIKGSQTPGEKPGAAMAPCIDAFEVLVVYPHTVVWIMMSLEKQRNQHHRLEEVHKVVDMDPNLLGEEPR
ncbi:hypothetical protein HAX54_038705 [Datura stramonium]|uniref:Uncharacterized protein n=1 Tax=Datura stramonium TaxID=4076 RepID=A0ABS8RRA8_DATST|nr:hypothetical protein [Datura stramonium]